jgi:hypothetical protein
MRRDGPGVHTRPTGLAPGGTLRSMTPPRTVKPPRPMTSTRFTLRYGGPLVLSLICAIVAGYVSPVVSYLLVIAAFYFFFEVATSLWERAGGTGGMQQHKQ